MTSSKKLPIKVTFQPEVKVNDQEEIFQLHEWTLDKKTNTIKRGLDFSNQKDTKGLNLEERRYLDKIYLDNLEKISIYLNEALNHQRSFRDWEIVVGPWLRISVFSFYDRWRTLEALKSEENILVITEKFNLENLVSEDFDHFHRLFYEDRWNAHIYLILAYFLKIKTEVRVSEFQETTNKDKVLSGKDYYSGARRFLLFLLKIPFFVSYSFRTLLGFKKITALYGLSSYRKFSLYMFFRGKGFPLKINTFQKKESKSTNKFKRLKPFAAIKNLNDKEMQYEDIIFPLLVMTLPKPYLENFERIGFYEGSKFIEKNIDTVFTSTSQWTDDSFKKWLFIKKKNNNNFKIVIWQHGGTYGTTEYLTHQEYIETKVYDKFLSWGWSGGEKVLPFIQPFDLVKFVDKTKGANKKKLLVILTRLKKYSKGDPWDSQEWNSTYVSSMINLSNKLKQKINISPTFRIHPAQKDTGLDLKHYLEEQTEDSSFDSIQDIEESICKSKLVIVTQNSTVFLQSMLLNQPTVCFWDEEISGFRPEAKVKFNLLREVGIFHGSVDTAIDFISLNYHEINKWWFSAKVQFAKEEFCKTYSSSSTTEVKTVLDFIER